MMKNERGERASKRELLSRRKLFPSQEREKRERSREREKGSEREEETKTKKEKRMREREFMGERGRE